MAKKLSVLNIQNHMNMVKTPRKRSCKSVWTNKKNKNKRFTTQQDRHFLAFYDTVTAAIYDSDLDY